jgi:hypothetical protein
MEPLALPLALPGSGTGTGTGTADKLKARLLPLLPPGAESGIAVQRGAVVPPALEQLANTATPDTCVVTIVGSHVGAAAAVAAAASSGSSTLQMVVWAAAPGPATDSPPANLGPSWGPVNLGLDDDGELRHLRAWSRKFVLLVTHGGVSPRQQQLGAAVRAALPPAVGMVTVPLHALDPAAVAAAHVVLVANAASSPVATYPLHALVSVLLHVTAPLHTACVCELCPYSLYSLDMLSMVVNAAGVHLTAVSADGIPAHVRAKVLQARPLAPGNRAAGPDLETLQAQLARGPLVPPTDHGAAVPRVVLTMIVRDEAALIQRCARAVWPFVDAFCILDTGSVDDTRARFFEVVAGVVAPKPGAYILGTWRGFGASRSEALALARAVHAPGAAWLLMIDADDIFNGTPGTWLPCAAGAAAHEVSVRFGPGGANATSRLQVFSRAQPWVYRGILHEYPFLPLDGKPGSESAPGRSVGAHMPQNFFIDARTEGYRSRNPSKYRDDALALEAALAAGCDDMDRSRYMFYLAQSWRDAGDTPRALQEYRRVATNEGSWSEERYGACMNLVELGDLATPADLEAMMPWVWLSMDLNPQRREVVALAMARCRIHGVKPSRALYAAALVVHAHGSRHCLSSFVFGRVQMYIPEVWLAELQRTAAALGYTVGSPGGPAVSM